MGSDAAIFIAIPFGIAEGDGRLQSLAGYRSCLRDNNWSDLTAVSDPKP